VPLTLPLRIGAVDLGAGRLTRGDGEVVALTPGEQRVLRHLADRPGQVVPRDELLHAWGGASRSERMLDTVIRRLRVKIEADPERPEHLLTAHGDGYRLVVEPRATLPLPPDPEPLFGRDRDLDALLGGPRAVVVLGPPGVGTSRLVLRAAHCLGGTVLHVDLDGCADADQVAATVAAALGVETGVPRAELDRRLRAALRTRDVDAIALDHAERVPDAVARLVETCRSARPELRVIVASRTPIEGLEPLTLGALNPDDAVALFLDRAAGQDAPWLAEAGAADAVRALVARLDRLPLARVLAASRSAALGPRALLDRLSDRFRLLAARGVDTRHASLRAALDLSWDLLGPAERAVAARPTGASSSWLAGPAAAQDFSAAAWAPLPCRGHLMDDPYRDESGAFDERDLVGDQGLPAGYRAVDADFAYFRLRLDRDPMPGGDPRPFAWGILLDRDGDLATYEAQILVNGIASQVELYANTVTTLPDDPTDPPDDPPVATWPLAGAARSVERGRRSAATRTRSSTWPWGGISSRRSAWGRCRGWRCGSRPRAPRPGSTATSCGTTRRPRATRTCRTWATTGPRSTPTAATGPRPPPDRRPRRPAPRRTLARARACRTRSSRCSRAAGAARPGRDRPSRGSWSSSSRAAARGCDAEPHDEPRAPLRLAGEVRGSATTGSGRG
jgi:DNA-binding winged helix-turn-helix (wHTH) protein